VVEQAGEPERGDLVLEEGATLRGCRLAQATFGELNTAKDNIGPGRALDPTKYFTVVVHQSGSGLSTSPHNAPGPYGQARFPRVRSGDDDAAQERSSRSTRSPTSSGPAMDGGGSASARWRTSMSVSSRPTSRRSTPPAPITTHMLPGAEVAPPFLGAWYAVKKASASAATAAGSIPGASLTTERAEVQMRSAMPPSMSMPGKALASQCASSPARHARQKPQVTSG
jgi:hypothetical protein